MKVFYTKTFLRQLESLPVLLQEEAAERIELFRDRKNHPMLKVYKLQGALAGFLSFSVNFRYRIVFSYRKDRSVLLHDIGDHDVYER